jgi:hypothetical protein
MVGKNFSANNLGQRKASDFYETPYSMTEALFEKEIFCKEKTILEPAYGNGAIFTVIDELGFKKVTCYDIERDFLKETSSYDYIITNPPFSLALEFVLKAKEICNEKFALFLPLNYLHSKKRYNKIYNDKKFPLARIYVFVSYAMLGDALRDDGKYRSGMITYAWYIWEKSYVGEPVIRWIDNSKYVGGF